MSPPPAAAPGPGCVPYFRDQTPQLIVTRFTAASIRAATNQRRRLLNSALTRKRGNGLEHPVCSKKQFCFSPGPSQSSGQSLSRKIRRSHVARPPCIDLRKRQTLRQLSGNTTNNQFTLTAKQPQSSRARQSASIDRLLFEY